MAATDSPDHDRPDVPPRGGHRTANDEPSPVAAPARPANPAPAAGQGTPGSRGHDPRRDATPEVAADVDRTGETPGTHLQGDGATGKDLG